MVLQAAASSPRTPDKQKPKQKKGGDDKAVAALQTEVARLKALLSKVLGVEEDTSKELRRREQQVTTLSQQLSEQTRRSQDKDKEIARLLAENALLRREPEGTRRRRRPEEVTTSAPEGSSLTPQPPRQDPTSPVFSPRQDSPGTATAGQERAQTSRAHSAPKPAQGEGEAQPKTAREARDSTEAAELQLNSLVKA